MSECEACGNQFNKIGNHWQFNEKHRPEFSEEQLQIITGILMGDGYLDRNSGNPRIKCKMTNRKYLEYLEKKLGNLSKEVKYLGVPKDGKSVAYVLNTVRHPQLNKFRSWYSTDEKVWPKNIELTPIVLKHWYCGDGTLVLRNSGSYHIQISALNEMNSKSKVNKLFERKDFEVSNWNGHNICFTQTESEKILEYMGSPLPGFEYKWNDKNE